MSRKLKTVEALPDPAAAERLLGFESSAVEDFDHSGEQLNLAAE